MEMTFGTELSQSRAERWRLVETLLSQWFPPQPHAERVSALDIDDAEKRLDLRLPAALREWYERYDLAVWSRQDRLLLPYQMNIVDGVLVFCVENQDVVTWGIRLEDLAAEDPPVVISDPDRTWLPTKHWSVEAPSTSAFAIQFTLMNVKWWALHSANGSASKAACELIEQRFERVQVQDMRWPTLPTRFYEGTDVIVECNGHSWIWVTANTPAALAEVVELGRSAGVEWVPLD